VEDVDVDVDVDVDEVSSRSGCCCSCRTFVDVVDAEQMMLTLMLLMWSGRC
jgi:hypothetical protein